MSGTEAARGAYDNRPWTVKRVVDFSIGFLKDKGIESARLDVDMLMGEVLGCERVGVYLQYDRPLRPEEREQFRSLLKRRSLGEPVAYILKRKDFMDFSLEVSEDVLIPRPDTEVLVEIVFSQCESNAPSSIVEIGTGSGCIAIALARRWPDSQIVATDVSAKALAMARNNAQRNGVTNVSFVESDFLRDGIPNVVSGSVDLLISNPPYIRKSVVATLDRNVKDFEPRLALDGGDDGLDFYRKLGEETPKLTENGLLAVETGYDQRDEVESLFRPFFQDVTSFQDYGGNHRVVVAKQKV